MAQNAQGLRRCGSDGFGGPFGSNQGHDQKSNGSIHTTETTPAVRVVAAKYRYSPHTVNGVIKKVGLWKNGMREEYEATYNQRAKKH